jgi:hypothetical protein
VNKFEFVKDMIRADLVAPTSNRPRLLDVGCRGCELKPFVVDMVEYAGVDLFQNAQGSVEYVLDVSDGLPFDDNHFDYVVALDLVEHLDDFKGGLSELMRISRRKIFVMIPNFAHLFFRIRFALSGRLSGKYDMRYGAGKDRHRWLPTQIQCDAYFQDFANDVGATLEIHHYLNTRKKEAFASICKIAGVSPNLWSWASLYIIGKPH